MTEELRSILPSTAGLGILAAVALVLTLARDGIGADATRMRASVRVAVVAILFQAAHFGEELATGFHRRFPELLGLAPWSTRFFVSFNLFWLLVWGLSVWGLTTRLRAFLFPLWFLGIASAANGLAHPMFSLRVGGYFPGLFTAPLVGIAGVLLLRSLARITEHPDRS